MEILAIQSYVFKFNKAKPLGCQFYLFRYQIYKLGIVDELPKVAGYPIGAVVEVKIN